MAALYLGSSSWWLVPIWLGIFELLGGFFRLVKYAVHQPGISHNNSYSKVFNYQIKLLLCACKSQKRICCPWWYNNIGFPKLSTLLRLQFLVHGPDRLLVPFSSRSYLSTFCFYNIVLRCLWWTCILRNKAAGKLEKIEI